MGLKSEDDKRPSKLAIMEEDASDGPRKFIFLLFKSTVFIQSRYEIRKHFMRVFI